MSETYMIIRILFAKQAFFALLNALGRQRHDFVKQRLSFAFGVGKFLSDVLSLNRIQTQAVNGFKQGFSAVFVMYTGRHNRPVAEISPDNGRKLFRKVIICQDLALALLIQFKIRAAVIMGDMFFPVFVPDNADGRRRRRVFGIRQNAELFVQGSDGLAVYQIETAGADDFKFRNVFSKTTCSQA